MTFSNNLSKLFLLFFFVSSPLFAQKTTIPFESVPNDPMNTRIYTLENGLKIYLSSYKQSPRIQTYIAVNTGSKNDPGNATGLAHYLEHIMFKGTSKFGTMNWEQEKIYLDRIEVLFEEHRATTDLEKRKIIYHQIDSLSLIAATYAIANEFDKMLSQIGATGTNAYTANDQTVYINDIPSNQLERWARIEAERMSTVVPRLFHTELEAVYEEKNRGLDNDNWKTWEALYAGLFPNHPYGTQTTIGTEEHLKSPSITEIKKYFNTYYKPNNMAICMSGDLNYDSTITILQKYFGGWAKGEIPATAKKAGEINGPVVKEVVGPTAESMVMAYRVDESLQKDPTLQARLKLLSAILYNGQAGLIDLKLNQEQKLQAGYAYYYDMHDYSFLMLGAKPVNGSSTQACQQLLLGTIEDLKAGRFDPTLVEAVIVDYKKSLTIELESNKSRADKMVDAFGLGLPWKSLVEQFSYMEKTTAKDIVVWANRYFVNKNLVTVFKKQGVDSTIQKIPKPLISEVSVNRDSVSAFYKQVFEIPAKPIKPVFLDFKKELTVIDSSGKMPVIYKKNKENNLFNLYYSWDLTKEHDPRYNLLTQYLPFLGSASHDVKGLSNAFYRIGCDYKFYATPDNIFFTISGLNENMEKAIVLMEELLAKPVGDTIALANLKQKILKNRRDQKTSKDAILRAALVNYATYGPQSPFTNIIPEATLNKITSEELLTLLQQLRSIKHSVLYYGPRLADDVKSIVVTHHKVGSKPLPPVVKTYAFRKPEANEVYWVDYNMIQAEIMILNPSDDYNAKVAVESAIFNEYFGGGMGSIVFQEIRESKALAYSAKSTYTVAQHLKEPNYQVSYIGTQADKLGDAMDAMLGLLNTFPYSDVMFTNSVSSLQEIIASERIDRMDVIFTYLKNKRLGITFNTREDLYNKLKTYTYKDLLNFHAAHIKGKTNSIVLVGSKDKLDLEQLKKYGTVRELTLEEVFGY
ncbi:MAG: pqqL [Cytophagaceae bacterium]|jgi:predicted Zn-dependent peptidase|nr:pqqL [Cytophagaceae bacterium]